MNLIQKMIYRVQRRKYGDARKSMLLLKYPNAFFLKPEYTADQYAEETNFTKRKAMIDWSWECWQQPPPARRRRSPSPEIFLRAVFIYKFSKKRKGQ